jgi:hypothetical protein
MALTIETIFLKMKKIILLFASIAVFCLVFAACSNSATDQTTADPPAATSAPKDSSLMKQTAVHYTCKMHPEVISDKPGKWMPNNYNTSSTHKNLQWSTN